MISLHSPIVIWLLHYKYLVLLVSVIVEGPVATMLAGLAVATGYMNFWLAYLSVISGEVGGDAIYYLIGYWGREKFILKYGRFAHIFLPEVERIERLFKRHGGKTLIISKISHVIGLPFLIAAGIAKFRPSRFVLYDFIATIPKSLALMAVGYFFSQSIAIIDRDIRTASIIVAMFIIIFVVGYISIGRYFYKKTMRGNNNS